MVISGSPNQQRFPHREVQLVGQSPRVDGGVSLLVSPLATATASKKVHR
jgi:hypothetical protein